MGTLLPLCTLKKFTENTRVVNTSVKIIIWLGRDKCVLQIDAPEKLGCTRTEKRTEKLKSKPTQIFMTRFTGPRLKFALQSSRGSQIEIPRRQGGKETSNSNIIHGK